MNNSLKILASTLLLAAPLAFAAPEGGTVHVSKAGKGANQVVGVDFESNGDVSAFQFLLTLPEDAKNINLSKCLDALPKTHTGMCQARDNRVAVVIYSFQNDAIPSGLQSVGKVTFQSTSNRKPELSEVSAASGRTGSAVGGMKSEVTDINEK